MSRPSPLPFVLWLLAFSSAAMPATVCAQCDAPVLSVHVESIFAGETGTEIDQRLGPEGVRLQGLFDYTSYRLLRTEEADTQCGKEVEFILPPDRVLHVKPLAAHGNWVALDLVLFAGPRNLLRQQLKLSRRGMLLLVGSENLQYAYITSLTIDVPGNVPAASPLGAAGLGATPLPPGERPINSK
jgi:hypothetical protein